MIREAKVDDITRIINLGGEIIRQSKYLPDYQPLKARKALALFINAAKSCVFVAEVEGQVEGFIIGAVDDYWWSSAQYASDMGFYVSEQHRGFAKPLINAFEEWVKRFPKVRDITLAVSSGVEGVERTGRFYQRLGYEQVGGMYTKLQERSR